ncbi:hypothetical protein MtrunA17_Chr3g0103831 [Medicago truncatula]|uniref:Uncharacterized protein n=1 Tax=Medicago truncatula TaxID=3880 RepID=A0A396IT47_MEDTR|nr:hypothetical protein MtrunA17_Chr3g0103831 [Medicago truncatula]
MIKVTESDLDDFIEFTRVYGDQEHALLLRYLGGSLTKNSNLGRQQETSQAIALEDVEGDEEEKHHYLPVVTHLLEQDPWFFFFYSVFGWKESCQERDVKNIL